MTAGNIQIILAGAAHIEPMARLHREAFGRSGWSVESLRRSLSAPGCCAFAATKNGSLAGFILSRLVAGEAEILTLCVEESMRRKGVALTLIEALANFAGEKRIGSIYLDVSEANAPAIALYEASGFRRCALRKNYYADGSAALIYRRDLP